LPPSTPDPAAHTYQSVPNQPPDSLLVLALSDNVRHVVNVRPVPSHPTLYAAPVFFLHPGRYRLQIDVEYRNYAWNSEPSDPFPFYAPVTAGSVNSVEVVATLPGITLPQKEVCGPGSDFSGRWIHLNYFRELYPYDYWGIEDAHKDDVGSFKAISTGNEWCAEGGICDCEDRPEDDEPNTRYPWAANMDIPLRFNASWRANTEIHFHFIGGLVHPSTSWDGTARLYEDAEEAIPNGNDSVPDAAAILLHCDERKALDAHEGAVVP
ncbi:hypothetical protein BC937DRAFT_88805, partial [Endogone sp. FLAS-F59071]